MKIVMEFLAIFQVCASLYFCVVGNMPRATCAAILAVFIAVMLVHEDLKEREP